MFKKLGRICKILVITIFVLSFYYILALILILKSVSFDPTPLKSNIGTGLNITVTNNSLAYVELKEFALLDPEKEAYEKIKSNLPLEVPPRSKDVATVIYKIDQGSTVNFVRITLKSLGFPLTFTLNNK